MTGTQRLGALAVAGVALAGAAYGVGRHAGAPEPSMLGTGASQVQYGQPGMTLVANAAPQAQGVVVVCAGGDRAVVRPTVVGGSPVSQIECVPDATAGAGMAQPLMPAATRRVWTEPVGYGTPAVYSPASPPAYRSVRNSDVVEYRPARRVDRDTGRSWKKSAVIIGSSAGVGAGVGAAVGGKKGALVGAAIGGGGAAIWDQITRRKEQ